jgi:ABC-type sugar transport system ATPase subunit
VSAVVAFQGIGKRFPGVVALDDVSFEVREGSCHALCGENGAGKSTLGKVLAGLQLPDQGRVLLGGRPVRFAHPGEALAAGIGMVHQELAFCENLSVADNLCLGRLPARAGFVSRHEQHARAARMLAEVAPEIDVGREVGALPVAQQQMVQIAGAVAQGARVIVFDEPTSSLTRSEAERLYALIRRLRGSGVTSLYVSHRLEEIFALCDTVTVLRDGRHVATRPAAELGPASLVQAMIGRSLEEHFPSHLEREAGEELLRVEGLSSPGRLHDVSFRLRAGEIVGLAGLVGAGRSELAQALFGLDAAASGRVAVAGTPLRPGDPRRALAQGVGYLPEDRKRQGLVLGLSVLANLTLPTLERLSRLGFVRRREESALGRRYCDRLRVKAPGLQAEVAGLSGGNQQKVVLARWLAARCRVLLLDEPTRGVDVGAKAEIHALVEGLAADGHAVLLISSELPELLRLSSRVLVLREGRLAGELARGEADQESLLRLMAGLSAAGPRAGPR